MVDYMGCWSMSMKVIFVVAQGTSEVGRDSFNFVVVVVIGVSGIYTSSLNEIISMNKCSSTLILRK
jgi:type IV secretory pathway VirB2 component (pilin)